MRVKEIKYERYHSPEFINDLRDLAKDFKTVEVNQYLLESLEDWTTIQGQQNPSRDETDWLKETIEKMKVAINNEDSNGIFQWVIDWCKNFKPNSGKKKLKGISAFDVTLENLDYIGDGIEGGQLTREQRMEKVARDNSYAVGSIKNKWTELKPLWRERKRKN